jgi:hypothetical protein
MDVLNFIGDYFLYVVNFLSTLDIFLAYLCLLIFAFVTCFIYSLY